jgi:hypothetical protein
VYVMVTMATTAQVGLRDAPIATVTLGHVKLNRKNPNKAGEKAAKKQKVIMRRRCCV